MTTISVRVEEDLKERAEAAAEGEGMSVSEWTRRLIQVKVGYDVPDWSAPGTLSKPVRHQLALLHRLIELVSDDVDEIDRHRAHIEVLENGYTGEYAEEFASIHDELSLEECRLTWDLLDMFRVILASVTEVGLDAIRELEENAGNALQFHGFDFNDSREASLASYARYLIGTGRWEELAVHFDDDHERGNSHTRMLGSYLRMLNVFQPIWDGKFRGTGRGSFHLSTAELAEIAQVWTLPRG